MGNGERVCLLERAPPVERLMQLILQQSDIDPLICSTDDDLLASVRTDDPKLALIDVGRPSESGIELLARVRQEACLPIIATSTGSDAAGARACLEAGADEYVAKPFDPDVLLEHVQFLLGRPLPTGDAEVYGYRSVRLDLGRRTLTVQGEDVRVSRTEWQLLRTLAANAGKPVFYTDLARSVLEREMQSDADYLALLVNRLQGKVGDPSGTQLLRTFHNIALILDLKPVSHQGSDIDLGHHRLQA